MFNDIGLFIRIGIFALFVIFVLLKLLYENFWKPAAGQGGGLAAPPLAQKDAEALRRFLDQMRGKPQPLAEAPAEAQPPMETLEPQVILGEALPIERKRRKRQRQPVPVEAPPPLPQSAAHGPSVHEYLEAMSHRESSASSTVSIRRTSSLLGTHGSLRDAILAGVILGKPKALERRPPPRCKSAPLR